MQNKKLSLTHKQGSNVFSRTQAKHPEGNKYHYIFFHAVFLLSHEMMKIWFIWIIRLTFTHGDSR